MYRSRIFDVRPEILKVNESIDSDIFGVHGSLIYKNYVNKMYEIIPLVPPNDIDAVAIGKKWDGCIGKIHREYRDGFVRRIPGNGERLPTDVFFIEQETFKKGVRKPFKITSQVARTILDLGFYGKVFKGNDVFEREFRKVYGSNYRKKALKIYLNLQGLQGLYDPTDADRLLELPPSIALKVLTIICYTLLDKWKDTRVGGIYYNLINRRIERKEAIRNLLEVFDGVLWSRNIDYIR